MKETSRGGVAEWYHDHLQGNDTYHATVIQPNLLRLLALKEGDTVADIACGEGYFSREFHKAGAKVTGVDVSSELIALARKHSPKDITFEVAPADGLGFLPAKTFSHATLILAIQNIAEVKENGVHADVIALLRREASGGEPRASSATLATARLAA